MLATGENGAVLLDTGDSRQNDAVDLRPSDVSNATEFVQQVRSLPAQPEATEFESDKFSMLTEVIYTCGMCSTSGMDATQYFVHMSVAHGIRYFCGQCDAGKTRPTQLVAHYALSHPSSEVRIRMIQGNELRDVVPETFEGWLVASSKISRTKQETAGTQRAAAKSSSPESARKSAATQLKRKGSTLSEGNPRKKAKTRVTKVCRQVHEEHYSLSAHLGSHAFKARSPKCTPKRKCRKSMSTKRVQQSARQMLIDASGLKWSSDPGTVLELTKHTVTSIQTSEQNPETSLPPPPKHGPCLYKKLRIRARGKSHQKQNDESKQYVQEELDDKPMCVSETDPQCPEGLQTDKNGLDDIPSSQTMSMDVQPREKQIQSPKPEESVRRSLAEQCLQASDASDELVYTSASKSRGQIDNVSVIPCLPLCSAKLDHVIMLPVCAQGIEKTPEPAPRRNTDGTARMVEVITLDDDNKQTGWLQRQQALRNGCQTDPKTCTPQVDNILSPESGDRGDPQPYSFYGKIVEPIPYHTVGIRLRNSDIKVSYQQLADVVPLQPIVLMRKLTFLYPYL